MKKTTFKSNNTKGAPNMKKNILFVLALAACLVFAFTAVATAKYAGYAANEQYLSWGGATDLNEGIAAAAGVATQTASPHGGYTQTSVKCVVCHSIHRAFTTATAMGSSTDFKLLNGVGTAACAECHAAWGASPSDTLVAVGETFSGPHIGNGGASCTSRGCHGSVHAVGADLTYAVVAKYNLQNSVVTSATIPAILDTDTASTKLTKYMDAAIAAGNVAPGISTAATGDAMKAYVTGYVCSPCHANSSFAIAAAGFANPVTVSGDNTVTVASGHPSAGGQFFGHAPTCEKCHDLVDVASNSTAFPHANRGIDVYADRFDYDVSVGAYGATGALLNGGATTIATDNTVATQYALWMTASDYSAVGVAVDPIEKSAGWPNAGEGGGFSLRDGSCLKCHLTDGSAYSIP